MGRLQQSKISERVVGLLSRSTILVEKKLASSLKIWQLLLHALCKEPAQVCWVRRQLAVAVVVVAKMDQQQQQEQQREMGVG